MEINLHGSQSVNLSNFCQSFFLAEAVCVCVVCVCMCVVCMYVPQYNSMGTTIQVVNYPAANKIIDNHISINHIDIVWICNYSKYILPIMHVPST